ncbi:MAG: hypothetical protein Q7S39_00885 [Ignavibacteria bacterium]|nr:hypothetical protein [Ignavibacteria bacterium]
MKILLPIFFFLAPFIFFSCGEEKTESTKQDEKKVIVEPKEIDACSFLDKEEVEKIFDIKMKDPKKGRSQKGDANTASFSECSFESDNEDAKIFLSVYIRFTPFKDEYHTTIQNVRNSFKQSGIEVTNIEGIGEVAFWGGNQLHVFKGDNYYLIITLLGTRESGEAIEKAKDVASHVIGNI